MSLFRGRNRLTFRTEFPGSGGAILPGGVLGILMALSSGWAVILAGNYSSADMCFEGSLAV